MFAAMYGMMQKEENLRKYGAFEDLPDIPKEYLENRGYPVCSDKDKITQLLENN